MPTHNDFDLTDLLDDHLSAHVKELRRASLYALYSNTESISATRELADVDLQYQFLNGGAADRDVELPPEATTNHPFIIYNSGTTNNLIIKDDSGVTTFITLAPDGWVLMLPLNAEGWKMLEGRDSLEAYFDTLYQPLGGGSSDPAVGTMSNGKLSVTVVADNLIVALKTLAGADPSASDAVKANINGTIYTITSALSRTVAAGTNWFNSGSAELAGLAVPYFPYLVVHLGVPVLTIARKSHYRVVDSTMGTTTDESYAYAYSSLTDGDVMMNIGYFEAVLSAGAAYTWSAVANVRSEPTLFSNWMTWNPQFTGFSVDPTDLFNRYWVVPGGFFFEHRAQTDGTSSSTALTFTIPFTPKATTNNIQQGIGNGISGGTSLTTPCRLAFLSTSNVVTCFTNMSSGTWSATSGKRIGNMQATFAEI